MARQQQGAAAPGLPSDLSRAIKAGNLERTNSLLEMDPGLIHSVDKVTTAPLSHYSPSSSLLSSPFLSLPLHPPFLPLMTLLLTPLDPLQKYRTPLHLACKYRQMRIASLLVSKNCELNSKNCVRDCGSSPPLPPCLSSPFDHHSGVILRYTLSVIWVM